MRGFTLTTARNLYKVTYIRWHMRSDKGNFFLSSRGTASKMQLKVFKPFWELRRHSWRRNKTETYVRSSQGFWSHWYLFCYLQLTSCWIKWCTVFSVTRNPKLSRKESNIWIFPKNIISKTPFYVWKSKKMTPTHGQSLSLRVPFWVFYNITHFAACAPYNPVALSSGIKGCEHVHTFIYAFILHGSWWLILKPNLTLSQEN